MNLPSFPPAEFDLQIAWARGYGQLEKLVRALAGSWLEGLLLFDVYTDVAPPRYALRLTFRHPERTLTGEDIEAIRDRIKEGVEHGQA